MSGILNLLKKAGGLGPMFFGVGFLAPLIAQSLDAASLGGPFGLTTLQFGLIAGLALGTTAKLRKGWL